MSKKIAFMGTPSISGQILKSLYQNGYPISVVYTQPPKKSNRDQKFNKSPINLRINWYRYWIFINLIFIINDKFKRIRIKIKFKLIIFFIKMFILFTNIFI